MNDTRVQYLSRHEDYRFNLIKGICILGVVSIHFGGSFVRRDIVWTDAFYLGLLFDQFFSFAVPVFIFLSGWLLQMAYGTRKIDWKHFFQRRLIKLGVPYLLVTIAYFAFFRKTWIIQQLTAENFLPRFFYYGIEPTLYFVPLISQLYLLFPFLKKMDDRLHSRSEMGKAFAPIGLILGLFFVMHIGIGCLAYAGKISYHWLCLRFCGFWLFYFYAGMQFQSIASLFALQRSFKPLLTLIFCLIMILFCWDMYVATDPVRNGAYHERNVLYFAYCRPEILLYNLLVVFGIGMLLLKPWKLRLPIVEFIGRYSYHVYIWHIPVLLGIAWENPDIISLCVRYPELIVFILCFVSGLISFIISLSDRAYLSKYYDYVKEVLLRLKFITQGC